MTWTHSHPEKASHACSTPDVVIVGCGRWLRRDDQAGLIAAQMIEKSPPSGCVVVGTEAPTTDIPNLVENVQLLIIVDAARSAEGHPPGTWQRMDYWTHKDHLAQRCRTDTHTLSVDLALRIAEEMGMLPPNVWIYAVTAEDCGYGEELSPVVARVIPEVTAQIESDISEFRAGREVCHA